MKISLENYREFEEKLLNFRMKNGVGTHHEYDLLEEGIEIWNTLTEQEQELLDKEGPQCFPSKAFLKYKEMTKKLNIMQKENKESTPEEDLLLDEMDSIWYDMSDKEIKWIKINDRNI